MTISQLMEHMKKLGYERRLTGRWIEELQDDGQGFPLTVFICPICGHRFVMKWKYCPDCGARLQDE